MAFYEDQGDIAFLNIGDKIVLQEDDTLSYLGSSGFSTTQLGVRPRGDPDWQRSVISESVFLVRQQQNYSVTKQLRGFMEREGMSEQEHRRGPARRGLPEPHGLL